MQSLIRNLSTVLLISIGLVVQALVQMLHGSARVPTADYLALTTIFLGVMIIRETFIQSEAVLGDPEVHQLRLVILLQVGIVLIVLGALSIVDLQAQGLDRSGIRPPARQLLPSGSYVLGVFVLLLKDVLPQQLQSVAKAGRIAGIVAAYALSLTLPAALLTWGLHRFVGYEDQLANHASVFGSCLAVAMVVREGIAKARSARRDET